ncbi:MAG: hypothetical protein J2P31_00645 [Blastocatellia bacterium]|nr:hypothetical protein [Blastocatellia bacterium]
MSVENKERKRFAICISDGGYPESLEVLKIYQLLPDPEAEKHSQLRVIDESGEDYLYFKNLFVLVNFPATVEAALSQATSLQH